MCDAACKRAAKIYELLFAIDTFCLFRKWNSFYYEIYEKIDLKDKPSKFWTVEYALDMSWRSAFNTRLSVMCTNAPSSKTRYIQYLCVTVSVFCFSCRCSNLSNNVRFILRFGLLIFLRLFLSPLLSLIQRRSFHCFTHNRFICKLYTMNAVIGFALTHLRSPAFAQNYILFSYVFVLSLTRQPNKILTMNFFPQNGPIERASVFF